MKKLILFILLQTLCFAGFSENARWKEFGIRIPARADLDVRWDASTNKLPTSIWVYRLLPRELSPKIISNLLTACSFSEKDKIIYGDMLVCDSTDGKRHLRVNASLGIIDYETMSDFGPTNLSRDVPSEKEVVKLTKKLLLRIGIKLSDIDKAENSSKPEFHVSDSETLYFVNHQTVTNIESRDVRFRRTVDGIPFIGAGTGGDGEIFFGDNGKVSRILITWRNLERDRVYPTATPELMINAIREGRAVQGYTLDDVGDIDWRTVKSVTIKDAFPCYYAGGGRSSPSDWLYPFAAFDTTVDTGHGNVRVEIDCPIFDETKL